MTGTDFCPLKPEIAPSSIGFRLNPLYLFYLPSVSGGGVVSASDLQSSSPWFKSRSHYYLDLFHGSPEFKSSATLVNSQLVCLLPVGIFNNVMFNLNYLFQFPAEGKYR